MSAHTDNIIRYAIYTRHPLRSCSPLTAGHKAKGFLILFNERFAWPPNRNSPGLVAGPIVPRTLDREDFGL